MIRLKSGVDYFVSSDKSRLVIYPSFGSVAFEIHQPYEPMLIVLQTLLHPTDTETLEDLIQADGQGLRAEAYSFLESKNLIVRQTAASKLPAYSLTRFERQLAYFEQSDAYQSDPEAVQERLAKTTIAIIGCGGAGAPVAEMLAAAGIGSLLLVDPDVVELSNLSRQIAYSITDIGKSKVETLKKRLNTINDQVSVNAFRTSLSADNAANLLKETDFAVVAADEPLPEIMEWIDHACNSLSIDYACISNSPSALRVGPIFSPANGISYSMYQSELQSRWPDTATYEAIANLYTNNKATTVWTCYSAAAILTGQIIQHLTQANSELFGRSALFDIESLRIWEGVDLRGEREKQ